MKFPYITIGGFQRPIIPIRLHFKEKDFKHHALIDSGADICIFEAEVGSAIGYVNLWIR